MASEPRPGSRRRREAGDARRTVRRGHIEGRSRQGSPSPARDPGRLATGADGDGAGRDAQGRRADGLQGGGVRRRGLRFGRMQLTRARGRLVAEIGYPSVAGTSWHSSVSRLRPMFTSFRDFDCEMAIWDPLAWGYYWGRLENVLDRKTSIFGASERRYSPRLRDRGRRTT